MNRERIIQQAEQMYTQQQVARVASEKMGFTITSAMKASREEIVEHYILCAELSEQHRITVDAGRMWGKSADEIRAFVTSRLAQEKRRSGVKALKRKYGHDAAERIIANKTGKHINIR